MRGSGKKRAQFLTKDSAGKILGRFEEGGLLNTAKARFGEENRASKKKRLQENLKGEQKKTKERKDRFAVKEKRGNVEKLKEGNGISREDWRRCARKL